MRTLLLATAAFAALVMIAPIGHAHAGELEQWDIEDLQDSIDNLQASVDALSNLQRDAAPAYAPAAPAYSAPTYAAPAPTYSTPPAPSVFVADCTFKNQAIRIELDPDGNHVNAAIHVGDKTVSANDRQMVDANGAGVGHKIFEVDTSTVWYVAPANSAKYHSAVKLNGKWRPMQCGGFAAAWWAAFGSRTSA
jgi:hypothetical protein